MDSQRESALHRFAEAVRPELGEHLLEMRLYGSSARAQAGPDSDLDVFIVLDEPRLDLRDRIIDLAFDVSLAHDVYISPRVVDRSIVENPVWRATPFLAAVYSEGIPI